MKENNRDSKIQREICLQLGELNREDEILVSPCESFIRCSVVRD